MTARSRGGAIGMAVLLGVFAGAGCVFPGIGKTPGTYRYFETPGPFDAWSFKIALWQHRQSDAKEQEPRAEPSRVEVQSLRDRYRMFWQDQKRRLAQEAAYWIQQEARRSYRDDGERDDWATFEETLEADGDDCDGLELLSYRFLLELGFGHDEVYRGIVYRASDGEHHMVTFWFEDAEDPWVIDPTGIMAPEMARMSEITDWIPLKVFNETDEYNVQHSR